jgi:two-component system sensor histidine kinase UhpB
VYCGTDNHTFQILTDNIDEAFWLTGADGKEIFHVSSVYQRLWQQTGDTLIAQPRAWCAAIHPEDRPRTERAIEAYLSAPEESRFQTRFRLCRPDGSVRCVEMRILPIPDENPCHLFLARDITELKQAHAALQESNDKLVRLTRHQETVHEAHRTGIAREIHDELGQALTVMNLDLYWLRRHCPPEGPIRAKLDEMRDLIERTASAVQDIATRLRPANLGAFGLEGALDWFISRFRQQNDGLDCKASIKLDGNEIDHDCSIALYRILQEALTNISRHARARSVTIEVFHDHDAVLLTVEDDGVGIGEQDLRRGDAWGLIGMRERTAALRGKIDIRRQPAGGTRLAVCLPLPRTETPRGKRQCEPYEPCCPDFPDAGG